MTQTCSHSDAWLMLPWLANGRLSGAERARIEEHVRECAQCAREVALQRQLCEVLTEPERVTYAPGPSFRKLMAREERCDRDRGEVIGAHRGERSAITPDGCTDCLADEGLGRAVGG